MLALLIRFLLWLALCTVVYFAAKYFNWSLWLLPIVAVVSLLLAVLPGRDNAK